MTSHEFVRNVISAYVVYYKVTDPILLEYVENYPTYTNAQIRISSIVSFNLEFPGEIRQRDIKQAVADINDYLRKQL